MKGSAYEWAREGESKKKCGKEGFTNHKIYIFTAATSTALQSRTHTHTHEHARARTHARTQHTAGALAHAVLSKNGGLIYWYVYQVDQVSVGI